MLRFGLFLISLGIVAFVVATIGASMDRGQPRAAAEDQFSALKWLMRQLRKPINNLTTGGLKWYRRVVALGEICLLIGLFLVVLSVIPAGDGNGDGDAPATTTTSSA